MTGRLRDNFGKGSGGNDASTPDPRLIELVRFLARRAAEKDYQSLLAEKNNKQATNQRPQ